MPLRSSAEDSVHRRTSRIPLLLRRLLRHHLHLRRLRLLTLKMKKIQMRQRRA